MFVDIRNVLTAGIWVLTASILSVKMQAEESLILFQYTWFACAHSANRSVNVCLILLLFSLPRISGPYTAMQWPYQLLFCHMGEPINR